MKYKYLIEFMGVITILYAKLLTEADPTVMAIVYFAAYTVTKGISTGFFTPLGVTAAFLIGRVETSDYFYNLIAHALAVGAVYLTFSPIKTYIQKI
jgi:hypothetical protein